MYSIPPDSNRIKSRSCTVVVILVGMSYFKMADSKKLSFSTSPKAEQFPPKFHGLVLGLVELINAKGIGSTQLIWS